AVARITRIFQPEFQVVRRVHQQVQRSQAANRGPVVGREQTVLAARSRGSGVRVDIVIRLAEGSPQAVNVFLVCRDLRRAPGLAAKTTRHNRVSVGKRICPTPGSAEKTEIEKPEAAVQTEQIPVHGRVSAYAHRAVAGSDGTTVFKISDNQRLIVILRE